MKNSDLWGQYTTYTEEFSKFSRQLGYAAVAICWLFKAADLTFPTPILIALGCVVAFFISDILQFFVSAHLLRWWTRNQECRIYKETGSLEGEEYEKPSWIDAPAFCFFNIKAFLLLATYAFIAVEFLGRMVT